MEKNSGAPQAAGNNLPKFDVWVKGLPVEYDLKAAVTSGEILKVEMMRKHREENRNSLVFPVDAELKVLKVESRRKGSASRRGVGSTRRELAVEVEVVKNLPKGVLDTFDDGLGLSAFTAGTKFTLVYWPDDGVRSARVSRSCEVLAVKPETEAVPPWSEGDAAADAS